MLVQALSTQIDEISADFAHPFPGPDKSLLKIVTLKCLSLYVTRMLGGKCGSFLADRSPGLSEVVHMWSAHRSTYLWDPLLGQLRDLSTGSDLEACYSLLVESGLRAHLDGVHGKWAFRFSTPRHLRVHALRFPSVIAGRIDADSVRGIALTLEAADGSAYDMLFQRSFGGAWQCSPSSRLDDLLTINFADAQMILLPDGAVPQRMLPNLPGAKFLQEADLVYVSERICRAIDLINEHSGNYVNWIGSVVPCLAPFDSPNQSSGSHPSFPGLVVMSNDPRPAAIAEMLVHEASHQYFYLVALLGPVDDGSDAAEYYSPLVGRARPIDKLLLSFHALANMALLLRACMASRNIDDADYCRRRLAVITAQAQTAEDALRKTASLTRLGKALWEPLAEILH